MSLSAAGKLPDRPGAPRQSSLGAEHRRGDEINLFDILPLFRLNDGDGVSISTKRAWFPAIRSTRITWQAERRHLPHGSEGQA